MKSYITEEGIGYPGQEGWVESGLQASEVTQPRSKTKKEVAEGDQAIGISNSELNFPMQRYLTKWWNKANVPGLAFC